MRILPINVYNQSQQKKTNNKQLKNNIAFGYNIELTPKAQSELKELIGQYVTKSNKQMTELIIISKSIQEKIQKFSEQFTEGLKKTFQNNKNRFDRSVKNVEDLYPDIGTGVINIDSIKLYNYVDRAERGHINNIGVKFIIKDKEGKEIEIRKLIDSRKYYDDSDMKQFGSECEYLESKKDVFAKDYEKIDEGGFRYMFNDDCDEAPKLSEQYFANTYEEAFKAYHVRADRQAQLDFNDFDFNAKP